MLAFVLFGLFFLMVFLNVPVAVALGLSSTIGLWVGGFSLTTIADAMYSAIGKFTLLAIPFFILANFIFNANVFNLLSIGIFYRLDIY